MRSVLIIISILFLIPFFANGQDEEQIIKVGNDLYRKQQFNQAEKQYRKALKNNDTNSIAAFNLGNALYRDNNSPEAERIFSNIISRQRSNNLRADAFYNKAVVLTKEHKLEEAVEAYKNTLRINPNDKEARENLQKLLLQLKKKNPPKDQNQKNQQQKQSPQSKMSRKEAEQKLRLLQEKEKEVQQRLQKQNSPQGSVMPKDW